MRKTVAVAPYILLALVSLAAAFPFFLVVLLFLLPLKTSPPAYGWVTALLAVIFLVSVTVFAGVRAVKLARAETHI